MFTAKIEEVKIFDRALTPIDVRLVYQGCIGRWVKTDSGDLVDVMPKPVWIK